ncbi:hypothetical protein N7468_010668 [Penicillium chermesinum]|uniref:Uncharacterized protein n=1 Tax=Penicillium chermesinum TaxID=63820 RepID=A0A9W9N9I0_9EURO|nr:uncharacterized protein N7468_010668 [Penicillium chermesinum]KAJ5214989.1 hypothetical protein N7468_010668 [Penicillium chermesinum]KAJ6141509.1 hypothetical protein N7470_009899 [Penicillium chermesinum]
MAIAEDGDRQVLMLQSGSQREKLKGPEELDVRTASIVNGPYLKVVADDNYVIRVDHSSDIMVLSNVDYRIPLSWRE